MELSKNNIHVFAAKHYKNEFCMSEEEFLEDLAVKRLVRKMANRFAKESSTNIRLFCNHVITFTNNFDLDAAKQLLLFETSEKEKVVLMTVFNYLGYTKPGEVEEFSLFTAKALKEMDK